MVLIWRALLSSSLILEEGGELRVKSCSKVAGLGEAVFTWCRCLARCRGDLSSGCMGSVCVIY